MIKKFLTFAFTAGAMTFASQAQQRPFFGVRAAFDVTHAAGGDESLNNGSGFTITGVFNTPVLRNVYFEPGVGVFYNTMGIKPVEVKDMIFDGSVSNAGLRVPLNFGYRVGLLEKFDLAVYTGPVFNFNFHTRARLQPNFEVPAPEASENLVHYGWRKFDAQWGFGVTATYNDEYYLAVGGGVGVSPMAKFDTPFGRETLRRNTLSIAVGYNF